MQRCSGIEYSAVQDNVSLSRCSGFFDVVFSRENSDGNGKCSNEFLQEEQYWLIFRSWKAFYAQKVALYLHVKSDFFVDPGFSSKLRTSRN